MTDYVLRVRVLPHVDETRALRAWLKAGLRRHGLKCVSITALPPAEAAEPEPVARETVGRGPPSPSVMPEKGP